MAAQFERDPLDRAGRKRQKLLADLGRSGKRQLANERVGRQFGAHAGRVGAGDQVGDTLRQTGLVENLEDLDRDQGRGASWAQHRGTAGGQRRAELAGHHAEWEVPGGDRRDDAHRLLDRQDAAVVGGRRYDFAVDAAGFLGVPLKELGPDDDLTARFRERLAILDRQHAGEFVGAFDQELGCLRENRGTLVGGCPRPGGKRGVGGLDRGAGLGYPAVRNLGDDLASGRVPNGEGLSAQRLLPLAVHEKSVSFRSLHLYLIL